MLTENATGLRSVLKIIRKLSHIESMAVSKRDVMQILTRWAQGEAMKNIASEIAVSVTDIYNSIYDDPDLTEAHIRARKIRAEVQVDDIIDIADNEPDVYRARLKTDVRRWTASKYNAALYGDKLDVSVNQSIDINPLLTSARRRIRDVSATEAPKQLESKSNTTGLEPVEALEPVDASIESIEDLI